MNGRCVPLAVAICVTVVMTACGAAHRSETDANQITKDGGVVTTDGGPGTDGSVITTDGGPGKDGSVITPDGGHGQDGSVLTDAGPDAAADAGPCMPTTCASEGATCGGVSDGCGTTLDCGGCDDPQTCGGGDVANMCGGCAAFCDPEILTTEAKSPQDVIVGATSLYWVSPTGTVRRMPKAGGAVQIMFETKAYRLAQDATHLYWTSMFGDYIRRVAKTGGTIEDLATSQGSAWDLALDSTHIYWTNDDEVRRMPKAGGSVQVLATGQEGARDIALDATHVYWGNVGRDISHVRRALKSGADVGTANAVDTLYTLQDDQEGPLVVDATHVYWGNYAAATMWRIPKAGGAASTFATADAYGPLNIAANDTHVYWVDYEGGNVQRRSKTGGLPQTLTSTQDAPFGIALDANYVYWTNAFDDRVLRYALCCF